MLSSQIQDLKDRLKTLEQQIATFSAGPPSVQSLPQEPPHVPATDWAPIPSNQDNSINSYAADGFAPSMIGDSPTLVSASEPIDGMGAVLLDNEELLTCFGAYSI